MCAEDASSSGPYHPPPVCLYRHSTETPRSVGQPRANPPAFWAVLAGQLLAGQRDETLVSIHIAVYSPASTLSAEAVTLAVPTSFNIRPIACVHDWYMREVREYAARTAHPSKG